jgi:hypothetical protein
LAPRAIDLATAELSLVGVECGGRFFEFVDAVAEQLGGPSEAVLPNALSVGMRKTIVPTGTVLHGHDQVP